VPDPLEWRTHRTGQGPADKLIEGYQKPEDLIGESGLLKQLAKALVERAMNAELTHHLGYEKNDPQGRGSGNSRNGKSPKVAEGRFWRDRH
jgi:putative transposase